MNAAAEDKVLTPVEVHKILQERKTFNIKDNKFPFYVMRIPLYNEFGRDNIRPALIHLVKTMQIKMGWSANDIFFDVAIGGRFREIEDSFLKRHNFDTL